MQPIAIELLIVGPNVRVELEEGALQELSQSIKEQGLLVPLLVVQEADKYRLIDGQRRFRAAQLAGLAALNAIVLDHQPEAAELKLMQLTINCQRADLSPLDKAKAYQEVLNLKNWTATQLAESLQLANSTVTMLLALLKLPVALQQMVNEGKLDVSKAYYLSRIDDPAEQARVAEQVASGKLSRASLAAKVKQPGSNDKTIQKRIAFQVEQGVTITVSSHELTLERLSQLLADLSKQVRKAQTQRIAVTTLAKQLADQCNLPFAYPPAPLT
jgi:ParB family transcriptional regulator, chromosome partitioning protein